MFGETQRSLAPVPHGYVREDSFARNLSMVRTGVRDHLHRKQQIALENTRRNHLTEEKVDYYRSLTLTETNTGLASKSYLLHKLEYEVARSKRYRRPLALLAIKIDQQEELEKRLSSMVLADLFAAVNAVITENSRDIDLVARLDNDFIAVLCPETNLDGALILAQRILQAVYMIKPSALFDNKRITASIGISVIPSLAATSVDLVSTAIESSRSGLEAGGNRIVRRRTFPA